MLYGFNQYTLVFENFAENFFDLPICKVRGVSFENGVVI